MMSQMARRIWGTVPSVLHPGLLVDKLLDQIEKMSSAILPVQVNGLSCSELEVETGLDQLLDS